MSDSDHLRLLHILDAIAEIEEFTAEGRDAFMRSTLQQRAVMYNFIVIGEAARTVSPAVCADLSAVPWPRIVGFRNLLTHEYYRIDLNMAWNILDQHLRPLKHTLNAYLKQK